MKQKQEYTGSCYVGCVGGELENGECRDSIDNIRLRNGDGLPVFIRATKGYEARQAHFDRWLNGTAHAFMLLLDHDMLFAPDTLERLRAHSLPYVSGFYLRRRFAPIAPIWFKLGKPGVLPMEIFTDVPESGKLVPIGASGWGCLLIHRDVAQAVQQRLKGEPLVIEDDMDVWPYDLPAILNAVMGLRALIAEKVSAGTLRPALREHVETLEREIRILRGARDCIGSDIRFPFFARLAGYTLMGDPDVKPAHMLNYPLSASDHAGQGEDNLKNAAAIMHNEYVEEARRIKAIQKETAASHQETGIISS